MKDLQGKGLIAGALVGLVLLVFTAGASYAQQTPPAPPAQSGTPAHEQMHRMMDAMHGQGASQRMHEAMGPEAEQLMDQCAAMMGMMSGGMMSGGMMDR